VKRILKKVNIVNAKGEKKDLKYKIPPESLEEVREAVKEVFSDL
jgi:hypothetical protein